MVEKRAAFISEISENACAGGLTSVENVRYPERVRRASTAGFSIFQEVVFPFTYHCRGSERLGDWFGILLNQCLAA